MMRVEEMLILHNAYFCNILQWLSVKFLSDLGGAVSLWLGISMVLIFELFDFILMLMESMHKHIVKHG